MLAHAEHCRAEIERLESSEVRTAELEEALAKATARRAKLREAPEPRAEPKPPAPSASGSHPSSTASRCRGRRSRSCSSPIPDGFGPNGAEGIELRLAPNPGIEAAPLRDAASGGELSRVMLALTGLGAAAGAGTLVFDEIDAGIGGRTARTVGERLQATSARADR